MLTGLAQSKIKNKFNKFLVVKNQMCLFQQFTQSLEGPVVGLKFGITVVLVVVVVVGVAVVVVVLLFNVSNQEFVSLRFLGVG